MLSLAFPGGINCADKRSTKTMQLMRKARMAGRGR